tara:strand:+ start:583 stop:822 length:240 start_codon:yes stop_codon:yes gene_type:complete
MFRPNCFNSSPLVIRFIYFSQKLEVVAENGRKCKECGTAKVSAWQKCDYDGWTCGKCWQPDYNRRKSRKYRKEKKEKKE